ncbi:MAG: hypothetical protein A2Y33_03385 [Spirochaetes bacterium GWF1_51_8]|nr:MAG: hypothetical protein A2Y33_03385 [Spirochaetes bacterium GWF1_51_8]
MKNPPFFLTGERKGGKKDCPALMPLKRKKRPQNGKRQTPPRFTRRQTVAFLIRFAEKRRGIEAGEKQNAKYRFPFPLLCFSRAL